MDPPQDFALGWLGEDGAPWGTPFDLIEGPDGSIFISDDTGGLIYRISYRGQ
jgi:glucose/arabinose dehydrogenase